jgi:predicted alpha/beta hydrolase
MPQPSEHRVATADGVVVALHRLDSNAPPDGVPILLTAGTFSSRLFWLGARRQGFAHRLAEAGFDTWILEPRGHGASERPRGWTMDDWIRCDAPAAVARVLDVTGRDEFVWVGHSAGGVVGAGFAGSGDPIARRLRGLVLLGAPGPAGLRGPRRLGAWATLLAGAAAPHARWPGRVLGLGPEREPGRLLRDWMWWNLSGQWRSRTGHDYLHGLGAAVVPVLALAGAGDRLLAPPPAVHDLLSRFGSSDRRLIVAGRATGFSIDYDHAGLVIGRAAREEIWPEVVGWISQRVQVGAPMVTYPPEARGP